MSEINKKLFSEYNIEYISNVMGLRKPQKRSLEILEDILNKCPLSKNIDLETVRNEIHSSYSIFKDFEHDFISLTFALATGVGKTKLMGTFITYLYTTKNIRNFFIVAPNITIYNKLKNDLGNPSPDNEKYVFKGVGCFAGQTPNVWFDDDYKYRHPNSFGENDTVNIYIFNISKFNSDERKMMSINEYLGTSFIDYLKTLDDLVLIMDESHHYRAKSSFKAINDLKPLLGLELTATPQVQSGKKNILFKNVVFEYPLSQAIKDGYTRTPYALTRRDLKAHNLTEEELDKIMINDGILHHEKIKYELTKYAKNNNVKLIKPFMLIVCKDTGHAEKVISFIKSNAFCFGRYKNNVILVHSNQSGIEKEENINQLLGVEKANNPIEIVIHVNILKEGWDVNNLYTIVPLRTAASKTLREQTVGRGLRLPYGVRTGDELVDSVTITAHDKFDEIIAEAQSGDSIFKAEGIIYAEDQKNSQPIYVQQKLIINDELKEKVLTNAGLDPNDEKNSQSYDNVREVLIKSVQKHSADNVRNDITNNIKNNTVAAIKEKVKEDLGKRFNDNNSAEKNIFDSIFLDESVDKVIENIQQNSMYIPHIRTENIGHENYVIEDFNLDLSDLNYAPISHEIMIKNLVNSSSKTEVVNNATLEIETMNPRHSLVSLIRETNEIDYEKCYDTILKVVDEFLNCYKSKYSDIEVNNICYMYKKDICNKLSNQIIQHLVVKHDGVFETVDGLENIVDNYIIDSSEGIKDLYDSIEGLNIKSVAFRGADKAFTSPFKFDSEPERKFAIVCENSPEVIRWLRPAPTQFSITYNHGKRYEPDFVVETIDSYYLVEIKGTDRLNDPDVLAKKEKAISYCKMASQYNIAHNYKPFKYLFIPHDEIQQSSSFNNLKDRFTMK